MFLKNLRCFERKNARGAALLAMEDGKSFSLCTTKKGEKNLYNSLTRQYYHSQEGALEEAEKNFSPSNPVHIQYGIGLGYTFLAAQKWLSEDPRRLLLFLESDLSVILRFLEAPIAREFFKHPQVQLYYLEEGKEEEVFEAIVWGVYPQKISFSCIPYYAKRGKRIENELFLRQEEEYNTIFEYFVAGIPFYTNFWRTLSFLPESYDGAHLFNAFKNVPIVCVVAGPSLQEEIEELRKVQDKAIIIAGGSAINILSAHGIQPHFGATCDPNRTQYMRFRENRAVEMPLFYRLRANHDAVRVASGKKLYLKGSDGFITEDFFVKKEASTVRVRGESGVSNLILYLAYALGARDIALVGYDLSYTNGEKYARGVNIQEDERKTENRISWVDYRGNSVDTEWKWISEARWISDFKKEHPRARVYNATPSGLEIEGLPRIGLKDFFAKVAPPSKDICGLIHSKLSLLPKLSFTAEKIDKNIHKFHKSLLKVKELLDGMETLFRKKKSKTYESVEYIELLGALEKEAAYKYFLIMFDKLHTKLDHFRIELFLHDTLPRKEYLRRDADIALAHRLFLQKVTQVNIRLLEEKLREV